jgi:D-galactarolactone cycloisomerase
MKIVDIQATPISVPWPKEHAVTLGIGRAVKRDAVIVKITTASGIVGYSEAHHGRAPGSIAHLINTTLRHLVLGMDATDTVGVWAKVYKYQLGSHGMGAAAAIGLSGIDLALWDIRGKAAGLPLYKLIGGKSRPLPAYAGGVALGYQQPEKLVREAAIVLEQGYKAIKLRVGDTPERDLASVAAVRKAFGDELTILVDANTGYTVNDARRVIPGLDDNGVGWLEEPFPAHDHRSYAMAKTFGRVALAAGENHYTRFEFHRVIEDGSISVLQPDLAKTGGMTEALRIAALASAWKLTINPHSSMTGLSMAASIHLLAAIDNGGYFEADVSVVNPFRDELSSRPFSVDRNGNVFPLEAPGLGLEVDEEFVARHPVIEGPAYV